MDRGIADALVLKLRENEQRADEGYFLFVWIVVAYVDGSNPLAVKDNKVVFPILHGKSALNPLNGFNGRGAVVVVLLVKRHEGAHLHVIQKGDLLFRHFFEAELISLDLHLNYLDLLSFDLHALVFCGLGFRKADCPVAAVSTRVVLIYPQGDLLSPEDVKCILQAAGEHFPSEALAAKAFIHHYPAESEAPGISVHVADDKAAHYLIVLIHCHHRIEIVRFLAEAVFLQVGFRNHFPGQGKWSYELSAPHIIGFFFLKP